MDKITSSKDNKIDKTLYQSYAQSSKPLELHYTGWDDEIVDPPRTICDDGASERFYQGIQQITKDNTIDDILALIPKDG